MEKNRLAILIFYAILSAVVVLCCMPDTNYMNYGMTLSFVLLIITYIARARWPRNESFEENHTTFLIRTIWIWSLLFVFGAVGGAIIVNNEGNTDAFTPMFQSIAEGIMPSPDEMRPWVEQYKTDNHDLLIRTFLIWLSPAQIYLVWRILKGGERAFKNYRVANPKSWL